MTRRRCVNVEATAGGGHLCTGRCGRPHLHGRRWSWWRCRACEWLGL